MAINRNPNDVTEEDSVFIPKRSADCINWVLGHIISARGIARLCYHYSYHNGQIGILRPGE